MLGVGRWSGQFPQHLTLITAALAWRTVGTAKDERLVFTPVPVIMKSHIHRRFLGKSSDNLPSFIYFGRFLPALWLSFHYMSPVSVAKSMPHTRNELSVFWLLPGWVNSQHKNIRGKELSLQPQLSGLTILTYPIIVISDTLYPWISIKNRSTNSCPEISKLLEDQM